MPKAKEEKQETPKKEVSKTKIFAGKVDRVSTIMDGDFKLFQVSCRGEEFDFFIVRRHG